MTKSLIVTHHAPDLDAITSVWLLKRFISQKYASAAVIFVNPGEQATASQIEELEVDANDVVHVDTGWGEFDHHQPARAKEYLSASALVLDHLCHVHPELKDDEALRILVDFTTEIDHFGEVNWPQADSERYSFMLHQLIHGLESLELHNDDSQLQFGMTCLDSVYQILVNHLQAKESIETKGQEFNLQQNKCLAIATRNDEVIKLAQKRGYDLVIRKDPRLGHIRIKARPDSSLDLELLYHKILELDQTGSWYFHQSGKMLLNGSQKNLSQTPSPLSLQKVVTLIKELYE